MVGKSHVATVRPQYTSHQTQQCGFTCSIGPDEANKLTRSDGERNAFDGRHTPKGNSQIINLQHQPASLRGRRACIQWFSKPASPSGLNTITPSNRPPYTNSL